MTSRRRQKTNPDPEVDLQEQLSLLTLENERLKAILVQNGLDESFNSAAQVPKDLNVTKRTKGGQRSMVAAPLTPITPKTTLKGCSCRGNCSTRVCGCVKKNVSCAESCRCGNELCQNQEQDKENIAGPVNQAQSEEQLTKAKKIGRSAAKIDVDPKKKKVGPASKTRVANDDEHRSLFSPGPTKGVVNFNVTEFEGPPLTFGDDTDAGTSENNENDNNDESNNKTTAATKNRRNKRENLKVAGPQRKLRSLSNQELETEAKSVRKGRNKRSNSTGRENSKEPKEKPAKTLASLINGAKPPLRRGVAAKAANSRAPNEENEENHAYSENVGEKNPKPKKTAKANKGKREMKNTKDSGKNVDRANTNENEETENYNENEETENYNENEETEKESEKQRKHEEIIGEASHGDEYEIEIKPEIEDDVFQEIQNVENPAEVSQDSEKSAQSNSSPMSEHASENSSFYPEDTEDFDPMKPRHKLSRSPIIPRHNPRHNLPHDVSEKLLPMPVPEQETVELPPPAELGEPVVDWEKHQAERVHCRKCGRGFYPYRIKKHEASCHNV